MLLLWLLFRKFKHTYSFRHINLLRLLHIPILTKHCQILVLRFVVQFAFMYTHAPKTLYMDTFKKDLIVPSAWVQVCVWQLHETCKLCTVEEISACWFYPTQYLLALIKCPILPTLTKPCQMLLLRWLCRLLSSTHMCSFTLFAVSIASVTGKRFRSL